jgi:hypothetical protein
VDSRELWITHPDRASLLRRNAACQAGRPAWHEVTEESRGQELAAVFAPAEPDFDPEEPEPEPELEDPEPEPDDPEPEDPDPDDPDEDDPEPDDPEPEDPDPDDSEDLPFDDGVLADDDSPDEDEELSAFLPDSAFSALTAPARESLR